MESTYEDTLQGLVEDFTCPQVTVIADDAGAYETLPFEKEYVMHAVNEHVRGNAPTDGVDPLGSILKQVYGRSRQKASPSQLEYYIEESSGRHSIRVAQSLDPTGITIVPMVGKRLRHRDSKKASGLDSRTRDMAA